jgi:hypothetical protein
MSIDFKKWIEMTGSAAVGGGGGTSTGDIASYPRPLGAPVRRRFADFVTKKNKKNESEEKLTESHDALEESKLPFSYLSMRDQIRETLVPKPDHEEFYAGKPHKRNSAAVQRARLPMDESVECPGCKKRLRRKQLVKIPESLREKYGAKNLCVECTKKKKESLT